MFNKTDSEYLKIAPKKLDSLSFCEASVRQLNNWVKNLPIANIGETSRLLYHAVVEINQLKISEHTRFDMLELIRKPIYYVCEALTRKYLEHALVLDDSQKKVANLSQSLQLHLATGYKSVVKEYIQAHGNSSKTKEYVNIAVHRCLCDLTPSLLRNYKLYLPNPHGLWKEIHQIYFMAKALQIEKFATLDPLNKYNTKLSVEQCYLRGILLSTTQPNQLQKTDLTLIYESIELWIHKVELNTVVAEKDVILIDPDSDGAPIYRYLAKISNLAQYNGINTLHLIRSLHQHLSFVTKGGKKTDIEVPDNIDTNLLQHLIQSWGGMKQRTFSRFNATGETQVCIGLSATHYHLSGGKSLAEQITKEKVGLVAKTNKFLEDSLEPLPTEDIWSGSFDASDNLIPINNDNDTNKVQAKKNDEYPKYKTMLVNTSPRGYCLQWPGKPANNLVTGEIVAIKENNLSHWNIGILRWIRFGKSGNTQMGIELISPNCQPCAARILSKAGEHGEYLRALYVPEIQAIGQPASVITAKMPFQLSQKVGINIIGEDSRYQLIKKTLSTSRVNQFQVRPISRTTAKENITQSDDSFDNLWRKL